jgi:translation initiation factor 2 subunit 1
VYAQINLVAAPTYVITAVSLDKDEGVELVTNAIEAIKQKIESLGGTLDVKHAVRVPGS